MSRRFDAIVLGTGIAGLSSAIHLAKRKKKVLLIGKKDSRGQSSAAASGILDPVLASNARSGLLKLSLESFRHYPAFIRELEQKTKTGVAYKKTGLLYLARNGREMKALRKAYAWQRKTGIPVKLLNAREVLRKEPMISSEVCGGLFYRTAGRVKPAELMKALKKYARAHGVQSLNTSKKISLGLQEKKVSGVRVGRSVYKTPVVVNATGAWAGKDSQLSRRAPVLPARGQLLLGVSKSVKVSSILHTMEGDYLVPWGAHRYVLGSTVEFVGFKPQTTDKGLTRIRSRVQDIVPRARQLRETKRWAGLRPFSKRHQPIVGPTSIKGLYLNTGYYRSGILIGYETGRLLSEWIQTGKAPKLLKAFKP